MDEYVDYLMWLEELDMTSRAYLKCLVKRLEGYMSQPQVQEIISEIKARMTEGAGALLVERYARKVLEDRMEQSIVEKIMADVKMCYKNLLGVRLKWGIIGLVSMVLGFVLAFFFVSIPSLSGFAIWALIGGMVIALWALLKAKLEFERVIDRL